MIDGSPRVLNPPEAPRELTAQIFDLKRYGQIFDGNLHLRRLSLIVVGGDAVVVVVIAAAAAAVIRGSTHVGGNCSGGRCNAHHKRS